MLELKFNHEALSFTEAVGITLEEIQAVNSKIDEVIKKGKYGGYKASGIVEDIMNCEEITKMDLAVFLVVEVEMLKRDQVL